jgi:hypothetical protein
MKSCNDGLTKVSLLFSCTSKDAFPEGNIVRQKSARNASCFPATVSRKSVAGKNKLNLGDYRETDSPPLMEPKAPQTP